MPSYVQYQNCITTLGATITDFGSRINSRQKALVVSTNNSVGVGNVSLLGGSYHWSPIEDFFYKTR